MIKGVNKRVVEITSTDHEYFEKAVLYVKADKSGIPAEKLDEEAREYLGRIVPVKRKPEISLALKLLLAAAGLMLALLIIYLSVIL